jgi:hypothetical protein
MEEFFKILIVSIAGFLGGFLGGQVGGGALITLPVLLALGLAPSVAMGTNVLHGVFGNLASGLRHFRKRRIDFRKIWPYLILAFLGAAIGAKLNISFDQILLKKIIAWLLVTLVILTLFKDFLDKKLQVLETHHKKGMEEIALGLIFLFGIYGGMFSIAITTLIAFLFLIFLGKSFIDSMAHSFVVTTFCLLGGSLIYFSQGAVNFFYLVPLTIFTCLGSWLGTGFAIKRGERWIHRLFLVIVIILVLKLILNW